MLQGSPIFHRSSASVYYCEHKQSQKRKNRGSLENEAGRGLRTKLKTNPNPQSGCFNMPTVWQQPCLTSQTQPTPAWISLIPRPHPKNQEKRLVTHVKTPICAVSAVFVLSRRITFIHNRLPSFGPRDLLVLLQDYLKNGNEVFRLFCRHRNLETKSAFTFDNLYVETLSELASSHFLPRSVHLLCNAIVNHNWLQRDLT